MLPQLTNVSKIMVYNRDGTVAREIEVFDGVLREPLVIADTESAHVWAVGVVSDDSPDPVMWPLDGSMLGLA